MKKIIFLIGFLSGSFTLYSNDELSKKEDACDTQSKRGVSATSESNFKTSLNEFSQHHFQLTLAGFHAETESTFKINLYNKPKGTTIDPEKQLGQKEQRLIPKLEMILIPARRHRILFSYWNIQHKSSTTLKRQIQFGDRVFERNMPVSSLVTLKNLTLQYQYSIINTKKSDIGLAVGIKRIFFDAEIAADIFFYPYTSKTEIKINKPCLGAYSQFLPYRNFLIKTNLDFTGSNWGNLLFYCLDIKSAVEYCINKAIGIGLEYQYFDTLFCKNSTKENTTDLMYNFNSLGFFMNLKI